MKDFLTIKDKIFRHEFVVEKSRFISFACQVSTVGQANFFIESISKQHYDATHNCYAYLTDEGQKFSDDGEPQGTAGLPILNAIKGKNLHNVAVVVTRYFGGVKLGAGGLVRAYSEAAAGACANATVTRCVLCSKFRVDFSYENYKIFSNFRMPKYSKNLSIEYSDKVTVFFAVKKEECDSFVASFEDFYNKKQAIERLNDIIYEFEEV